MGLGVVTRPICIGHCTTGARRASNPAQPRHELRRARRTEAARGARLQWFLLGPQFPTSRGVIVTEDSAFWQHEASNRQLREPMGPTGARRVRGGAPPSRSSWQKTCISPVEKNDPQEELLITRRLELRCRKQRFRAYLNVSGGAKGLGAGAPRALFPQVGRGTARHNPRCSRRHFEPAHRRSRSSEREAATAGNTDHARRGALTPPDG